MPQRLRLVPHLRLCLVNHHEAVLDAPEAALSAPPEVVLGEPQ